MKSLIHTALFLLLISLAGASYAQIPQIERDALVALYNSTGGANWTNNTGWMGAAGTECGWFGVNCANGNIVYLALYNNTLSGSIPSELGNLTNLTYLNLYNNSLGGSIPPELGNLTNLTYLSLHTNSLSGSIPHELGNLTNLRSLNLHTNSLSGGIPSELGNLTNLTKLNLYNNSLGGSIPSELGNLTNLTTLYLVNNSLSGSIPSELGNLTSLTTLNLRNNSLSGSIPFLLGNLTNLTDLDLSGNSLSGSISSGLGNLTNLTYLYLDSNSLTGSIPSELGNLTNLTDLSLSSNSLTGPLPQWLSDLSLTYLNITSAFTASPVPYEPTSEWPSPYNGVTPDSSFGLAFNNVGVFNASDAKIYVCLRIFTDGSPSSVNGVSQFDVGLELIPSLTGVMVKIAKFREFNAISALNEDGQTPDCSGKFETTTGVYTDIIQTDTSVLETTWSLIDPNKLILKLDSFKELTAK